MDEIMQEVGAPEQAPETPAILISDEEAVSKRFQEAGAVEETGQLNFNLDVLRVKKMFEGNEESFLDFATLLAKIDRKFSENPLLFTRTADVRRWAELVNGLGQLLRTK